MNDIEIVFLNTPIYKQSVNDGEDYLPPLGQGYIVTQLIKNGINARLIDCVNERMGIEDVVALINDGLFLNVALNVFSVNLEIVENIVEKTKRRVNWYFGGKAIEHLWKDMLHWNWKENNVTYTIGECDTIYTDLLLKKCVEKPIYQKANQSVYRVDKYSVYFPRDLDKYVLDRGLFKDRAILNHYGRPEDCLIGSRGCIYNCAFCGGSRYANANSDVRVRSSENIINEIQNITNVNLQIQSIRILDDLFLMDRCRILQAVHIFSGFHKIHWRGMAHVYSFLKNMDLLENLKNSGCDELFIGIESGSSEIRKMIHKVGTVEDVINVISRLLEVGIDVKGYFICGFPNESKSQIIETVRLANTLKNISKKLTGNFRTTVFQFRPYHGTELYDQLISDGKLIREYCIGNGTSSKKQYSFIADNYSAVDEQFLKKCITEICEVDGCE